MLSSGKKNRFAIFYVLTLRCPSAEHASLFPCLMQHIQSELMTPPSSPSAWNECCWCCLKYELSKKSNQMGGIAILSLPYRLFINLTIRSDAWLLLQSVHIHSSLTSTNQWPASVFSSGLTEQKHFLFDILFIRNTPYTLSLKCNLSLWSFKLHKYCTMWKIRNIWIPIKC